MDRAAKSSTFEAPGTRQKSTHMAERPDLRGKVPRDLMSPRAPKPSSGGVLRKLQQERKREFLLAAV